ncbi:hypothetical protein [Primorskyibacter sp. 2E107]|uniref:hypothetical protein n=1 Tax=Primorskyibacter sp. 2E107 TaxID=3403458 RepID=UPI003AF8BD62
MRKTELSVPRAVLFVLLSGMLNPGGLVLLLGSSLPIRGHQDITAVLILYTLPCLVASVLTLRYHRQGASPVNAILGGFLMTTLLAMALMIVGAIGTALLDGESLLDVEWLGIAPLIGFSAMGAVLIGLPPALFGLTLLTLLLRNQKTNPPLLQD